MEVIGWYTLFAVTTSFAALYELIHPVMFELSIHSPKDVMVEHKFLSYFVFFGFSLVIAPLIIIPVLVPSLGEQVRNKLLSTLLMG
jgi:hypothetical protein